MPTLFQIFNVTMMKLEGHTIVNQFYNLYLCTNSMCTDSDFIKHPAVILFSLLIMSYGGKCFIHIVVYATLYFCAFCFISYYHKTKN